MPATDWRTVGFVAAVARADDGGIGLTPLATLAADRCRRRCARARWRRAAAGRVATLRLIVIGEVAVAVALLVGAALLGRSFAALLDFDPGFRPQGVLALRVQLPLPPVAPRWNDFDGAGCLRRRLRQVPVRLRCSMR